MELALFVYLASVTLSIKVAAAFITLISGLALIAYTIYVIGFNIESSSSKLTYKNRWAVGWICLVLLTSLIPSERTMWMMAGAYGAQKVVQSDVGTDVLALINLKIKKELADMKKESSK
jgi:hypothetical protein